MKKTVRYRIFLTYLLMFIFVASVPSVSQAQWWKFGSKSDIPEITDLKFNSFSAYDVDERMTIGKDALDGGKIIIRGRAEAGDGKVGKVDISLDGGSTWKKATLGDRGNFVFELTPEIDREYDFRARVLSTTGKSSDVEEYAFFFAVAPTTSKEDVKKAFFALLRAYINEDYSAFMRLVSDDFEGNKVELEDAISDDFRYFSNIRIEPNITRIVAFDNSYEVYFTFTRQMLSTTSGTLLNDSAATTAVLKRAEEGFLLLELAAPLIFGVSNPSEIATSITEESVGQEVIVVDEDGNATTQTQPDTVEGLSSLSVPVENGEITQNFGFFEFDLGVESAVNGDIQFEANGFFGQNGATLRLLTQSFDSITKAPGTPYVDMVLFGLGPGSVVGVALPNGDYAVLEITSLSMGSNVSFRYKHPLEEE